MSLFQGMIARVLLVLVLVLGGSLWLVMDTTRDYLHHQFNGYAQDSANSLALALQPYVAEGDLLTADTMITALVQSGHYASIELRDSNDGVLLERRLGAVRPRVPEWFTPLFSLQPPAASAAINRDWDQVASVSVHAYPGLAYQQLWRLARGIFGLGLAGAALAVALAWRWSRRRQQEFAAQLQSLELDIIASRGRLQSDHPAGPGGNRALEEQAVTTLETSE